MRKTNIVYTIYKNEKGLLIHPETEWGGHIFNTNGYPTFDDAVKAIESMDYPKNHLNIIPTVNFSWE